MGAPRRWQEPAGRGGAAEEPGESRSRAGRARAGTHSHLVPRLPQRGGSRGSADHSARVARAEQGQGEAGAQSRGLDGVGRVEWGGASGSADQPHQSRRRMWVQSPWSWSSDASSSCTPSISLAGPCSCTHHEPLPGRAWPSSSKFRAEGRPKGKAGDPAGPESVTRPSPKGRAALQPGLSRPCCRWTGWSSVCSWRRTSTSTCSGSPTTSPWVRTCCGAASPPAPAPPHPPTPGRFSVSSAFQPDGTPPPTLTRTGKQGLARCAAAH